MTGPKRGDETSLNYDGTWVRAHGSDKPADRHRKLTAGKDRVQTMGGKHESFHPRASSVQQEHTGRNECAQEPLETTAQQGAGIEAGEGSSIAAAHQSSQQLKSWS
eukprot:1141548-Pelagomonas_calceolata.AAC.3